MRQLARRLINLQTGEIEANNAAQANAIFGSKIQ